MKKAKKILALVLVVVIAFQMFQHTGFVSLAEDAAPAEQTGEENKKEYNCLYIVKKDSGEEVSIAASYVNMKIDGAEVKDAKVELDSTKQDHAYEVQGQYFSGNGIIKTGAENTIKIDLTENMIAPKSNIAGNIFKGDSISVTVSPAWDILLKEKWTIQSSATDVLTCNTQDDKITVKAEKAGKANVKMVLSNYGRLQVEKEVTVLEPATVKFLVEGHEIHPEKVKITKNNDEITKTSDGKYKLIPGERYQCEIPGMDKVEFTAKSENTSVNCKLGKLQMEQKVTVCKDAKYTLKAAGQYPGNEIKWQWKIQGEGTGVSLQEDNTATVLQATFSAKNKETYTVVLEPYIEENDKQVILKENFATIQVMVFDQYRIKVKIQNKDYSLEELQKDPNFKCLIERGDGKECNEGEMKPDETYKIALTSPYTEDIVQEVKPETGDENIVISLGKLKVTAQSIKSVQADADGETNAIRKMYDASKEFKAQVQLKLPEGTGVLADILNEQITENVTDDNGVTTKQKKWYRIRGEVEDSGVQKYQTLQGITFEDADLNQKFIFTDKVNGTFIIEHCNVTVKGVSCNLGWRSKEIQNLEIRDINNGETVINLSEAFRTEVKNTIMQQIHPEQHPEMIKEGKLVLSTDENSYVMTGENVTVTFLKEEKEIPFTYVAENPKAAVSKDMLQHINWYQEQEQKAAEGTSTVKKSIRKENGSIACVLNSGEVTLDFATNKNPYYNADTAYDTVYLQMWNGEDAKFEKEKITRVELPTELKDVDSQKKYGIYLDNTKQNGKYATCIGIMKFYTGETKPEEETQTVDGREVPVVYIHVVEAPDATFTIQDTTQEAAKLISSQEELKQEGYYNNKKIKTITFAVKDSEEAVSDVKCAAVDIGEETSVRAAQIEEYVEAHKKTMEWQNGNAYDLSKLKDGRYIVVAQLSFSGNTYYYASYVITLDAQAPDIKATFRYNDNETFKAEKEENKRTYCKHNLNAEFILEDTNLDLKKNVDIAISAKNGKGTEIEKDYYNEQISWIKGLLNNGATSFFIRFEKDANYVVTVSAYDKAGNKGTEKYYFTVDTTKPEGSITVLNRTWKSFLSKITFGLFSDKSDSVVLKAEDATTDYKVSYMISDEALTAEEVRNRDEQEWKNWKSSDGKIKLDNNTQNVIYERIKDAAGNTFYASSDGMVFDNQKPVIKVMPLNKAKQNNIYNEDIDLMVTIKDPQSEKDGSCSKLKTIRYYIDDGTHKSEEVKLENVNKQEYIIKKLKIDAERFNSNRIRLHLEAEDYADNTVQLEKKYQIDVTDPKIEITYSDNNETKFYNQTRTATVTITERNFKAEDATITVHSEHGSKVGISSWTNLGASGKSDDTQYTCRVTFDQDDDYDIAVTAKDEAGNQAEKVVGETFTIDKTNPEISVSYDAGAVGQHTYFNRKVTATVTVKEHNFEEKRIRAQIKASLKKKGIATPALSRFSGNGDTHTATVTYAADGDYQMSVEGSDKAGNNATSYTGPEFTVDMTQPKLSIENVQDQSANRNEVKPLIICSDNNFDANKVSVTVTGANHGKMDLKQLGLTTTHIADGQSFTMQFPKTEAMDDRYELLVQVQDKAGNREEKKLTFSVNRYGAVYSLEKQTGSWLNTKETSYIQKAKDVVVVETDVNDTKKANVSCATVGKISETHDIPVKSKAEQNQLDAGQYYTVENCSKKGGWSQKRYTIKAGNFEKEGRYNVTLYSEDAAANKATNVSTKHKGQSLPIEFVVDHTAPTVVISGAEDQKQYRASKKKITIAPEDNFALKQVEVDVNGETTTYTGKQVSDMDGEITVNIKEDNNWQTIKVNAIDRSGNQLRASGEDGSEELSILVTPNVFIQLLNSKILLASLSAAGLIVIGAVVAIVVVRRKKKNRTIEE